jgi:hypothetical protein
MLSWLVLVLMDNCRLAPWTDPLGRTHSTEPRVSSLAASSTDPMLAGEQEEMIEIRWTPFVIHYGVLV